MREELRVMDEKVVSMFLSNGFAVGVTVFLLVKLEHELSELRKVIEGLRRCAVCKVPAVESPDRKPGV